jgi:flagellar hook-associated protein 3 FlgL
MRITEAMMLNTALENQATASSTMAQLTQEASSGLRVAQPSDDPVAWSNIQQQDSTMSVLQARGSAATQAGGDLDLAESTLAQATDLLTQAQSIAVEGANGTETAASRANAATQVTSLTQQLVALANTRGSTGYLFGGTASNVPPFDASGVFHGNGGTTSVEIADGVTATSNASGADAFTAAGGTNVFAALEGLATALSSNDPAGIQASIGTLGTATTQLTAARIKTGLSASVLTSASTAIATAVTQIQVSVASEADADAPSTLSSLQAAQTSFQAAIDVNKEVLSASLAALGGA